MSINSQISGAKRALATIKAAAETTAIAKRGMFAMVERRHSSTLLHGAYAGWIGYTPCIVSSIDRDGIVKEVQLVGQSWPLKRRDWQRVTVDSAGRIADPEAVVRRLVDESGNAVEYRGHNEAVTAIKAAMTGFRQ